MDTPTLEEFERQMGGGPNGEAEPEDRTEEATLTTPDESKSVAESDRFIITPSAYVRLTDTAKALFKRIAPHKELFLRGGRVVELIRNDHGDLVLSIVTPSAARSRFEKYAVFVKFVKLPSGKPALQRVPTIPKELAEALLESKQAATSLPRISGLLNCPIGVESPEKDLRILVSGYDKTTRILITGGGKPPEVELNEAVAALKDIFREFDFTTPEDHSRAIAALLTPGLKIGGHLRDVVPVDVAEADQSQSGKTYRQRLNAAVYNERVNIVTCKSGGVGSVDETLNEQLVAGRPFIQLDNFRGKFDSCHLESFLTADGLFPARVPHRAQIDIDPHHFFINLTSNGVDLRPDLANRSNIISIRKKPADFSFRKFQVSSGTVDLLEYIRFKQPYYLGCVFAVIREWLRRGKQRTDETRHDRREWCQTLDWIVQHICGLPPMMGGHRDVQARVSTPNLVFLRQVCLAAQSAGSLGTSLKATDVYELCLQHGVEIPGIAVDRREEEEHGRKVIGGILTRIFKTSGNDQVVIDGFRVERTEESVDRLDGKGTFPSRSYVVTADSAKVQ